MAGVALVIKGGTLADGRGGALFEADIAVDDGRIVAIGANVGAGRQEIDARGRLVTPGFVDVHTHYDAQATWSSHLTPSSNNGVTTILMGNCGVGFAPVHAHHHDMLIELMEGVEDIPAPVMHEGLEWSWETFPEYLNALDSGQRDTDICALLPHAAVRVYENPAGHPVEGALVVAVFLHCCIPVRVSRCAHGNRRHYYGRSRLLRYLPQGCVRQEV